MYKVFSYFFIFISLFSIMKVDSTKCYVCDSEVDKNCEDAKVESKIKPLLCPKSFVCLKGVTHNGRITRACATVPKAAETCKGDNMPSGAVCEKCSSDLCNSSSTLGSTGFVLMLNFMFLMICYIV